MATIFVTTAFEKQILVIKRGENIDRKRIKNNNFIEIVILSHFQIKENRGSIV